MPSWSSSAAPSPGVSGRESSRGGEAVSSSASAVQAGETLPELAQVHWRRRVDEHALRRAGRLWTLSTVAHTVPFLVAALVLGVADPILLPFALLCLVHAWAIPELYAARGARVAKRVAFDQIGRASCRERGW